MSIKVSIVVPIYNVEKYLNRCLKSLLDQSYSNIEIILVNDGSPDKSPEMCDEYARTYQNIKVVHKVNGGLSDARNAGLEVATGEYIMFIDSDDYAETNMIEKLLDIATLNNSDVVIFGYFSDHVDENENLLFTRDIQAINCNYNKKSFKEIPIVDEMIGLFGYAWNKFYKSDVIRFNNMKFIKGISLVEDIVFNGPFLMQCENISFVEDMFIHYMQRPRITLGNKFYENYFDLKLMAIESVENLLVHWNKSEKEVIENKRNAEFNALKSTVRLLSVANNYDNKEKVEYLKKLFNVTDTQLLLKSINVDNKKDKLIRFLMKTKRYQVLIKLYQK